MVGNGRWVRLGIVSLAFLASVLELRAQDATIQGIVVDPGGGVIPAAAITVTNAASGIQHSARTNEAGFYSIPFLYPGSYAVTAKSEGFSETTRENLKLDVQQIARVDFELVVGEVRFVVEVSSAAALLESEQASMGQVIENKRIVEMPLNRRNYLELAQLSAGILPGGSVGGWGTRAGQTSGGFVGMGIRGDQNNVMVDGIDNSSRAGRGAIGTQAQAATPSVDAVAEFKVLTNNMSAEYGYRMGPKVLVSIKSGTNELHGSAFHFLRNDKLDATNFFANRSGSSKPTLRQNQFGATLGGPIVENKTFGFFSYQGTRIRLGRSFTSTVPSRLARGGDFSMERRNLNQIFDPESTTGAGADAIRSRFPNNVIPQSRFDPVSAPIVELFPLPNVEGQEFGFNNYFRAPADADDSDLYDFRVDHNFSNTDRVFFRMSVRRQFTVNQSRLPTEAGGDGGRTVDLNGDNLAFNWTHSFGPTLHNEARFGFTHFPTRFDTLIQEPLNLQLGIKNAPGDSFGDGFDQGFSEFNLLQNYARLGTPCCFPTINNMDNVQIVDNLLWQRGAHSLRFGFDYRRLNVFREAMRYRRGQFIFPKVFTAEQPNSAASRIRTGNNLAEMMLGWVGLTRVGNSDGENVIVPYFGSYVEDAWKATPKLTVTMGLRWELFHRGYFPEGHIRGRTGVSNYITEFNGLAPGREEFLARPVDGSDCGCELDRNNFAPRVGLAYRLNDKTVVRASGGVFYGEADWLALSTGWISQAPDFTEVVALTFDRTTPVTLVRDGFLPVKLPADEALPGTEANAAYRRTPTQYAGQWFVDVQRELPGDMVWTVGYQGSSTSHLTYIRDANFGGPHPTIPAARRRIRPSRSEVNLLEPGGNANYNALLTRLEKRFTGGLTFLSSYTWAHNIDQAGQLGDLFATAVQNPNDRRAERASAYLDRRHSFTTSFTWELPFGRDRAFGSQWGRALEAIVGGWQIGGIVSLRSGFPVILALDGDPQNSGTLNRGDRIGRGELSNPTIDNWFDQSAFVLSKPGVFGNSGRNVVRGPGATNIDFMLGKRFGMPWEGHGLQFRFEAFNFTNTPRFGQPFGFLGESQTGTINQAEEPRRIQFGLKYLF